MSYSLTPWLWDLDTALLASGAWHWAHSAQKAHFPCPAGRDDPYLSEGSACLPASLVWRFWMWWSINYVWPREGRMAANVPKIYNLPSKFLVKILHQFHPPTWDFAHSAKHRKTGISTDGGLTDLLPQPCQPLWRPGGINMLKQVTFSTGPPLRRHPAPTRTDAHPPWQTCTDIDIYLTPPPHTHTKPASWNLQKTLSNLCFIFQFYACDWNY